MKRFLITLPIFFTFVLTGFIYLNPIAPTPVDTYDPSVYGLPPTIAGYPVVAVRTSENTACMSTNIKEAIIQISVNDIVTGTTVDSRWSIRNANLVVDELNRISDDWSAVLIALPSTKASIKADNEKWNQLMQEKGCVTLGPAATGSDNTEFKSGTPSPGYAAAENTNASASSTTDNGQSVNLIAPLTDYYSMPNPSAFLNNVVSDGTGGYLQRLMQNGFLFVANTNPLFIANGNIVYVPTNNGFRAISYFRSFYYPDHSYEFTIAFSGYWQLCYRDLANLATYQCVFDMNASGTSLYLDFNTAVYVENQNSNANWNQGFSTPWKAYGAVLVVNGLPQQWSTQHRHTLNNCVSSWPPANAINGSLVNGGLANFNVTGIPLRC